jgi:hypothetical protein
MIDPDLIPDDTYSYYDSSDYKGSYMTCGDCGGYVSAMGDLCDCFCERNRDTTDPEYFRAFRSEITL